MKNAELKKLTRQIVALVLVFSLVAGMQPALARAAGEQKTITNIALATADDAGAYTFYNGFNDNWYMAPGTLLDITYSDGSKKTLKLHRAFLKAEKNSVGNCVNGQQFSDYMPSDSVWDDEAPFLGTEYATSPYMWESDLPFTIKYDGETNAVSAVTEDDKTFTLYTAQYKPLSEMPELSTENKTVAQGARYMRFYRVSGPQGTAYRTYTALTSEQYSIDTILCAYEQNGAFVRSDDDSEGSRQASVAYKFTQDTPSYVIGLMGYHHNYELRTEVCTEKYDMLRQLEILGPATVYPQFESCTADYKLIWEDGHASEQSSIYATGSVYEYGQPYCCSVHYTMESEAGQTVYGLTGRDQTDTDIFTAFPSGSKVLTVEKNNATNHPVYTAGTKVVLKPRETKLMYMNVPEGAYIMANNATGLELMTYSLAEEKLLIEPFTDYHSTKLSGEYAILVSNPSKKQAVNFRLLNLNDTAMTKDLPEYKAGQTIALMQDETAIYRFTAGSTYISEIEKVEDSDSYMRMIFLASKAGKYVNNGSFWSDSEQAELAGEGFLIVSATDIPYGEKQLTVSLKDATDPTKNISGAAAKEKWESLPVTQGNNSNTTQATQNPNTKPTDTPQVDDKKTSIKGETATVSKVTYKAISDSEAAVSKVKKVKTITSYKVPKTVTINGKKVKVTTIESNAFKGAKKLKKVTVASNVKTIKANAFKNCKKLKTIVIDNANVKIKKNAFKGCKTITFKVKKSQIKKFTKMLKKAKIGCKYKVKKK